MREISLYASNDKHVCVCISVNIKIWPSPQYNSKVLGILIFLALIYISSTAASIKENPEKRSSLSMSLLLMT